MITLPATFARMTFRGTDKASGSLFSYMRLEDRIVVRNPIRIRILSTVDDVLVRLHTELPAFMRLTAAIVEMLSALSGTPQFSTALFIHKYLNARALC